MCDELAVELGARVALAAVDALLEGTPAYDPDEDPRLVGYREMARTLLRPHAVIACPVQGIAAPVAIAAAKAAMGVVKGS